VTRDSSKQQAVGVAERAGAPMSSTEAIRRAVEALGHNAGVPDILDYIRDHFGIDTGASPGEEPEPGQAPGQAPEEAEGPQRAGGKRSKPKDRPAP
jgi:hypothetical protein